MSRYYLHLRHFGGDLIKDEEGSDLPSLAVARDHATIALREILADAIEQGRDIDVEAIVVMDERERCIAAVPAVAALPAALVSSLKDPAAHHAPKSKAEEYRQYAAECRQMAENAVAPDDKASWLKLADAWLQMLPKHASALGASLPGWPKPSDEDSQASH
jgi:hypothetical protein